MRLSLLVLLGLAGLPAGNLHAQRMSRQPFPFIEVLPRPTPREATPSRRARLHPRWLAIGGIVGGAVGVVGGALAGAKFTENDCEDCALVGGVYGAVAGGSALLPVGVHLANGRREGLSRRS